MPENGVPKRAHAELMTEEEMIQAVEAAAALGITKVRITGGEPLTKPNVISICRRTAAVKGIQETDLTTNGIRLPEMAKPLAEAGVSRINMSLDTLDDEKYRKITRGGRLSQALSGLQAALKAGFSKIKINAVLIGGFNDDEIETLAYLTKIYPVDMRFIELMPMPGLPGFDSESYISAESVLTHLPEAEKIGTEGVARLYRLPGAQGNIGLISPVSCHFCRECNRIRLTADGHLKPCLHSRDEICIRGMNFEEMKEAFAQAISMKPKQHDPLSAREMTQSARTMNRIGG
jgi:cyclic pyranopterin phosphate synthase